MSSNQIAIRRPNLVIWLTMAVRSLGPCRFAPKSKAESDPDLFGMKPKQPTTVLSRDNRGRQKKNPFPGEAPEGGFGLPHGWGA